MSAVAAWWANPVSAALVAAALYGVVVVAMACLVAIVRLGGIQLGGLLTQRADLLPGYPRRGDPYGPLLLFMLVGAGVCLLFFSLAAVRAGRTVGLGSSVVLALTVFSWLLAAMLAVVFVRAASVEPMATVTLVLMRPWTPVLSWLARQEGAEDEAGGHEEEADEHEVQAFIGAGEDAGILEREDAELIESIVELSDTVAREIMTPRTDVVALPVGAAFESVKRQFAESMFTRLPVYRDSLDRIEGIVHVKDVLRAVAAGQQPTAGELLRPVLIVPETKPLRELLREFQSARQQLAVVVDEYGGTSGIVGLEDVLEEIVGEIEDEHQPSRPEVEKEGDGAYLVAGGANVEVLEELFGVEIGEGGFDSVAGLVLDRLGHLPRPGEKVSWKGIALEAVEIERRRLRRVRVRRETTT